MKEENVCLNNAKHTYNRLGLALLIMAVITNGLQWLALLLLNRIKPGVDIHSIDWLKWAATFVPLYLIGIPIGLLLMKKLPVKEYTESALGAKNYIVFLLMSLTMLYGGNLIGTLLSSLLSGSSATNAIYNYSFDSGFLKVLILVFAAPFLEEFVFRKQLIDRCSQYGEKTAIMFSGLTFGLFHQNLYQLFYAFGIGLVFAYVYSKTRRLRYSVSLHMIINLLGSVIAPALLSKVDADTMQQWSSGNIDMATYAEMLPDIAGYILYSAAIVILAVIGLILIIIKVPKLVFVKTPDDIPKGEGLKTVYLNTGTLLFCIFCIAMFVYSLFA